MFWTHHTPGLNRRLIKRLLEHLMAAEEDLEVRRWREEDQLLPGRTEDERRNVLENVQQIGGESSQW
ncbi:hypothetical protein ILYODFUR_026375 [Ilyodon furcidens]|uniref:Uncharacterized protein n=1 Tax=Ilyodon furcidens TaxID=33524 RepID=A0ABV0VHK5_9TELE